MKRLLFLFALLAVTIGVNAQFSQQKPVVQNATFTSLVPEAAFFNWEPVIASHGAGEVLPGMLDLKPSTPGIQTVDYLYVNGNHVTVLVMPTSTGNYTLAVNSASVDPYTFMVPISIWAEQPDGTLLESANSTYMLIKMGQAL